MKKGLTNKLLMMLTIVPCLLVTGLFAGEPKVTFVPKSDEDAGKVVLRAIAPPKDGAVLWAVEDGHHQFLGVEVLSLTPELLEFFGVAADSGVLVGKVEDDGPAARSDIRVGDILTAIDGEPFASTIQISHYLAKKEDGAVVEIDVWRNRERLVVSPAIEKKEIPGFALAELAGDHLTWVSEGSNAQLLKGLKSDDNPVRMEVLELPDVDLQKRVRDLEARLKQLEKLLEEQPK